MRQAFSQLPPQLPSLSGLAPMSRQTSAEYIGHGLAAIICAWLLGELTTVAPPKDREVEAAKARARAAERYGRAA